MKKLDIVNEINDDVRVKVIQELKGEIFSSMSEEINGMINNYIEKEFNFNAFQENLDTFSSDLGKTQDLLNSQQIYLNNLNNTQLRLMNVLAIKAAPVIKQKVTKPVQTSFKNNDVGKVEPPSEPQTETSITSTLVKMVVEETNKDEQVKSNE